MLELYFLSYRIPKMMTRLARERKRSAVARSLIGVGVWIAAEVLAAVTFGLIYGIGFELAGWPERSPGANFLLYVLSLVGALVGVTIFQRILSSKTTAESFLPPPPPPQESPDSEANHVG